MFYISNDRCQQKENVFLKTYFSSSFGSLAKVLEVSLFAFI